MQGLNMMEYKGFTGIVEYDSDAKIFHNDVVNTCDVITFQGTSVKEIEKAFAESIDDYLNWCKFENVESEKPYSRNLI
jgi:predicted HicB family RNase H-like nuclease